MKKIEYKNHYKIIFIITIFFILYLFYLNPINKPINQVNQEKIFLSTEQQHEKQWLNNPDFTTKQYWYSTTQGDESDVHATIREEHANFMVLGDEGSFSLVADPPLETEWMNISNPELPILPDNATFDQSGILVEHKWDGPTEQLENNPSIHFKQNITMPVNMSDYIITFASIQTVVNATATVSPINGGIEREGDSAQYLIGDYIRFYIVISDINDKNSYPIAEYKTIELGKDGPPAIDTLNDTFLIPVPEEILISYLTSILKTDNYNFTIVLGIDIYCEDNLGGTDRDYWNEIRIKKLNLTFTYKKKIDRFTVMSWNQDGRKISNISDNQVIVKKALLNFLYKIDIAWPTFSSPNSEIRILINNNRHSETIRLSSTDLFFKKAKLGGFDVTSLIIDDVNLSIQVFIADTFELGQNITISIDDVYLQISYIIIYNQEPWIFSTLLIFSVLITIGLCGYLIAYQKILKYPKPIRKVRKYRKTLRKTKDPELNIISREMAFKNIFSKEINTISKYLKGRYITQKDETHLELEKTFPKPVQFEKDK